MKIFYSLLAIIAMSGMSAFAADDPTLEEVRAKMNVMFQEIGPEHINASPVDGWYTVQKDSVVAYVSEDGRYLLVRRPGNRVLTMLSTAPPHRTEGFAAGISSLVRTHLGVALRGTPRVASVRRPVHTLHPYTGGQGAGYLRALAVEVAGDPKTDALFDGMQALRLEDAVDALSTDLERLLLQDGARLLSDTLPAGWTASTGTARTTRAPQPVVNASFEDDSGDLEEAGDDTVGDDAAGDDGGPLVAQIDDAPEDSADLDGDDPEGDDSSDDDGDLDDLDDAIWMAMTRTTTRGAGDERAGDADVA